MNLPSSHFFSTILSFTLTLLLPRIKDTRLKNHRVLGLTDIVINPGPQASCLGQVYLTHKLGEAATRIVAYTKVTKPFCVS